MHKAVYCQDSWMSLMLRFDLYHLKNWCIYSLNSDIVLGTCSQVKILKRSQTTEEWVMDNKMLLIVMNNVFHRYELVDCVSNIIILAFGQRLSN